MEQLINGLGLPLLVSAAVALGGQYVSNSTNATLLQKNLEVTERIGERIELLNTRVSVLYDRSEREKNGH